MRTVALPDGARMPALGLGTWRMGERAGNRRAEVDAVRTALMLGYRLVDTAEMYGNGNAEEIVGEALRGVIATGELRREQITVVSKVLPHNASKAGTARACEASLRRLGLDCIDLYLLHWRGQHPLEATIAAFEALRQAGRVTHWGVSNFDADDLAELIATGTGAGCAANQVYYSASRRGVEFDLLPAQRKLKMPVMAYCPLDEGTLARNAGLASIGKPHNASAAQVALAWLLRAQDVIVIPKAVRQEHLRENFSAAALTLGPDELAAIDRLFPPPKRKSALTIV
ncbi:MAG TPA: aldo/keto reductase [Burkholderiaceae bacterium]|nr:aldo/keto reductase [Burkholderiaceae bacterium]